MAHQVSHVAASVVTKGVQGQSVSLLAASVVAKGVPETYTVRYLAASAVAKSVPPLPNPPTLYGSGIFARAVTAGRQARWLMEIEMGADVVRVCTGDGPATVHSRTRNTALEFDIGLSDFSSPVTVDRMALRVRAPARQSWADYRAALGPIRGRHVRVWRWYEGIELEDAYLVMDGIVEAAEWGDPGDPETLRLTASRAALGLSVVWPRPEHVIKFGDQSWTQNAGKAIDNGLIGQNYPTIFGAPGDAGFAGSTTPLFAVPGILVQSRTTDTVIVVAGHHVNATQVRVFVREQGGVGHTETCAVTNTYDNQGVPVATVTASYISTEDQQVFVGWSRAPGWGLGLEHRGRPIDGLGDLLIWGADTLTTAHWDFAEMEAQRQALNRYKVDTYWNDPVAWEDWVQSNVFGKFPVVEIQGPNGRYYREIVWEASYRYVQGRLTTGTGGGRRVERLSGIAELVEGEIVNALELDYAIQGASKVPRKKLVMGGIIGPKPGPPSGAQMEIQASDVKARQSESLFGNRYEYRKVDATWDEVTAARICRWVLGTRALPARRARYIGSDELLDFTEYTVVELVDTGLGGAISALAIIEDITITSAGVVVDVVIPEEPLLG